MREIDCNQGRWLPVLCYELGLSMSPEDQCIVCVENGVLIAGMVYNMFNLQTVAIHILINSVPSPQWWWAVFDYPFNQLGLKKTICQIRSDNLESIELAVKMGAVQEGRIVDFFQDADLMIYTIKKEDCRVLNSPRWKRASKWAA